MIVNKLYHFVINYLIGWSCNTKTQLFNKLCNSIFVILIAESNTTLDEF
jgi:hypothetical protein